MTSIERIDAPSAREFERRYARPGRPVILRGVTAGWAASERWTPDYLRARAGRRRVVLNLANEQGVIAPHPDRGGSQATVEMTFARALSSVLGDERRRYYLGPCSLRQVLPELEGDVQPPPYASPDALIDSFLWLAARSVITTLHYDTTHNLHVMLSGAKRWILFPPDDAPFLYPRPFSHPCFYVSRIDLGRPDPRAFPLYRRTRPLELILGPGEALFLPAFWWHYVVSLEPCLSVNFWWKAPLECWMVPAGLGLLEHLMSPGRPTLSCLAGADLGRFAAPMALARFLSRKGQRRWAAQIAREELGRPSPKGASSGGAAGSP